MKVNQTTVPEPEVQIDSERMNFFSHGYNSPSLSFFLGVSLYVCMDLGLV